MSEGTRQLKPASLGYLFGIAAAVSFGISVPLAKSLLDNAGPQILAGLLYLGAFAALLAVPRRKAVHETPLRRADVPRLSLMVLAGGVVAPVLLLLGLERVSGISGSLLVNLEGPLTVLVGVTLFREHLGRSAATGSAIIFLGAALLSIQSGGGRTTVVGALLVAAACACWALDNNLTQSLTLRDPREIVRIKTGVAGAVNLGMALALGDALPGLDVVGAALALGAISYGLSVLLDAYALRSLGAAREAAVFATAPFAGALLSPFVLGESFDLRDLAAAVSMAIGLVLLLRARHEHTHRHEELEHEHIHTHDAHHDHKHAGSGAEGQHSHVHRHEPLVHSHEHVSDLHHRHDHQRRPRGA